MWLDQWDPVTHQWVLTNLAANYGFNSNSHGWATWLYGNLGLFNAAIGTTPPDLDATQIWRVDIGTSGFTVSQFAPVQLGTDKTCLTGMVSAQPNLNANTCFDGQRLAFVRRCYGDRVQAYWNNTKFDGTGSACVAAYPSSTTVPVLRTYVVELDNSCVPKKSWGYIITAHEPSTDNIYKQMGNTAEWGEMHAAISADGNYLAFVALKGPPSDPSACAGFSYGLLDRNNPTSGGDIRILRWCPLSKNPNGQVTCSSAPTELSVPNRPPWIPPNPPPGSLNPGFFQSSNGLSVVFSLLWSQYHADPVYELMQNDLGSAYQLLPFGATYLQVIEPIAH
jgi:hypothetical protein